MRGTIILFLLDEESGAVTVDWIVLTAVVTALGTSLMALLLEEDSGLRTMVSHSLAENMD